MKITTKPSELFDLAREVYFYLNANPLTSRGILNSHFRTSSDDKRNRQLTEALEALMARLYVFKFLDEGTSQVFFWTSEFKDSPYEPDDEPILDYTPVDIFASRPVDELEPGTQVESGPVATPYEPTHTVNAVPRQEQPNLDENSPEFKAMQKMYEKVGGKLKPVYEVMMKEPLRIWGKAEDAFSFLGDHVQRAMVLGRMFGLGYIRRFKDSKDPKVSYYTIYGTCPDSLVEDSVELGKAAIKRQKAAQEARERKEQIDRINEDLKKRAEEPAEEEGVVLEGVAAEEAEEEVIEEEQQVDEQEDEAEEETVVVEPACYLSNTGELFIRKKDNSTVDLDLDESMAVIEIVLMMNPEALRARLEKYQLKKEQTSE